MLCIFWTRFTTIWNPQNKCNYQITKQNPFRKSNSDLLDFEIMSYSIWTIIVLQISCCSCWLLCPSCLEKDEKYLYFVFPVISWQEHGTCSWNLCVLQNIVKKLDTVVQSCCHMLHWISILLLNNQTELSQKPTYGYIYFLCKICFLVCLGTHFLDAVHTPAFSAVYGLTKHQIPVCKPTPVWLQWH